MNGHISVPIHTGPCKAPAALEGRTLLPFSAWPFAQESIELTSEWKVQLPVSTKTKHTAAKQHHGL